MRFYDGVYKLFGKKNLKWLGVVATLMMTFVQLGGALVTKTGSADGCGSSWPLCHGALIPEFFPIDTIIELSHRAVSALSLLMVLWLVITAWKHIGYIKEIKPLSIISVGFLLLQALIGAAAVIWQQNDYVLALHFGISLISFSSVFLITLIIFSIDQNMKLTNYISKAIKTFNMVNGNHHLLWCLYWCTSETCGCKFSIWWLAIAIPRSCTTFRTRLGSTHASYHGFYSVYDYYDYLYSRC